MGIATRATCSFYQYIRQVDEGRHISSSRWSNRNRLSKRNNDQQAASKTKLQKRYSARKQRSKIDTAQPKVYGQLAKFLSLSPPVPVVQPRVCTPEHKRISYCFFDEAVSVQMRHRGVESDDIVLVARSENSPMFQSDS